MAAELVRHWWVFLVRGLAGVLFGLGAFLWPRLTLVVLVALFGAYALVDGIFALVGAFRSVGRTDNSWILLLEGIAGIAAGLVTFFWPGISAVALLIVIAAWAIVTGVFEMIVAVRLREEIEGEWLLMLSGLASLLLGLLLIVRPAAGALAVVWLVGSYAIMFGVLFIALALRLRGIAQRARTRATAA
jgi:uncharacterized membrane protein HdeD (DUF308 family)